MLFFHYPKNKKKVALFAQSYPRISDGVISYNVSVIIVSIAIVSMSIIVSASIVMVVESIAASSEGLLVQDAKVIMPATNANASTFFIFVVFLRLVEQKYY